nr:vitrosamine synthase [Rauvolfia tetraphylla]
MAAVAAQAIGTLEKKYAVVTGSNKGIGFETCKKLASQGITVVLTARDEKRGLDALEKLKELGFSDKVLFHLLDVTNSSSVTSLAEFVKNQFGRLDILVNNAGVNGVITDAEAVKTLNPADAEADVDFSKIYTETYELAEECLQINYYGTKRTTEAFLPLLQLSASPRIVNISSVMGLLKNIPDEWAKGILGDASNLTEERVDEVINGFLKDFKKGSLAAKGWPPAFAAYTLSKAAVNAYTRILARKYPNFKINCVCPGFAKTDMNHGLGLYVAEEVAENPVRLALLPDDGPSGLFFDRSEESSYE